MRANFVTARLTDSLPNAIVSRFFISEVRLPPVFLENFIYFDFTYVKTGDRNTESLVFTFFPV